jgi:hypothetical protein
MARLSPVSEGRPRGGFDPDSPALHTSELLRQGIERRRPLLRSKGRLRDEVRRLLASEAPDPMLGIYALHLLLQESSADTAWLQEIRDRLRDLGLAGHPDLQAVELVFEGPSKDASFERPPLLLQSWQRIVAASVRKIDLVPAGFLAFDISTQVVRGGAWLVWRKPGSGAINKKNKAAKYGKKPSRFDLFTGLDELSKATPRTRKASMHMGHLAQTVLAAIETEISQRDRPSTPEELAHRLVDRLGLPAAYLEEQVREILRKLGRKRPTGAGPRKAKIET